MTMAKIFYILLWITCIGFLSFAYDDFLEAEFSLQELQGMITKKGVEKVVSNMYGNYRVENEYWLLLNGDKIVVTEAVYKSVEANDEVKVSKTKYGTLIERH